MPAAEPRYCVAQVTEEARDGWRDFCDANGIDRTAFAEVIGMWLDRHHRELPVDLAPLVAEWVEQARDLKNTRRRRG